RPDEPVALGRVKPFDGAFLHGRSPDLRSQKTTRDASLHDAPTIPGFGSFPSSPRRPRRQNAMRSGRIQNPTARARECENTATERQNRIVRVAMRRMMMFKSAL